MWQKIKNIYHLAQALFSAIYFNFPSTKLTVIGVTGTDGKTTTVNMIYHILKTAGKKVSMISSVNAQIGEKTYDTGFHVSTPSPFRVQKYLKKAQDAGSKYFILESTSHGLDQNRLSFVNFKIGVLTNISHEHLDYHKTFDKYIKAKTKLFKSVDFAVLNMDDPRSYKYIKSKVGNRVFSYSIKNNTDVNLGNFPIELSFPGTYNIYNALAAASACVILKVNHSQILKALKSFRNIRGRLEEINEAQKFKVVIDFAHTPNGLDNVLQTLKSSLKNGGRLVAVFGAAGNRDTAKRPLMGEVADLNSDVIILTAEDPRNENAKDIAREIAGGIGKKRLNRGYFIIPDRKEAIEFAINNAKDNDIIGIFGKGHEKSMNITGKELPWDEFKIAKDAIRNKSNEK